MAYRPTCAVRATPGRRKRPWRGDPGLQGEPPPSSWGWTEEGYADPLSHSRRSGLRLLLGPHELHQDSLADQERRPVGADDDLDHALVGLLGGVVRRQLARPEHRGAAQHLAVHHL